jgi:oligosaccharide repeat unit polymerase
MILSKISKIPLHNIKLYIIIHGILLFVLRPYLTFTKGENVITGKIITSYYNLSFLIGIFAFFLMLYMVRNIKSESQISSFTESVSTISIKRFLYVFSFWFFIYLLLNFNRFGNGFVELLLQPQSEFIHSNSNFISNSITGIYPVFILASFSINATKRKKNIILIFLILLAIPIGMISGSKTLIINPLLLLLFRYSALKKGVSFTFILIFLLIGLPVFASLEVIRHEGLVGIFAYISNNDFFNLENILVFATNRFYGTDILYSIIYYHEYSANAYLFGSSLLGIIFFIIPRFLWEEKPIISFGKIVSENYLGNDFWSTGISAAPTWIGELFANFGLFSLPIYILSMFLIVKYIKSCFKLKTPPWKKIYYFPIAFTTLSFFQEASIAGWILQLIVFSILCFLFSIMFHGLKNSLKIEI